MTDAQGYAFGSTATTLATLILEYWHYGWVGVLIRISRKAGGICGKAQEKTRSSNEVGGAAVGKRCAWKKLRKRTHGTW